MKKLNKLKPSKKALLNAGFLVVSGVILALPFLRPYLGWLSVITLLPFLSYLLWLDRQAYPARKIIKYIWLVGMVFMAITVSWMFQLNTIGLLQDPITRLIFIPFTLALMVLFFSSGFVFFGWLYTRLKVSLDSKASFLLIPAIWTVGEWLRSVLFSIGMLGEGGSVGMHWNFGALGLGAAVTPLVFASRIVGMFGLSFVVVLVNLAIFQLMRRKFVLWGLAALATAFLLALGGYYAYSGSKGATVQKVGIVHLGSLDDKDFQTVLDETIKNQNPPKVNLVIFPEYSHLFDEASTRQQDLELVGKMLQNKDGRVITTRSVAENGKETNAIVMLTPDSSEVSRQGKTFLIPGGEYIPYLYKAILIASANYDLIRHHAGENAVYQSKTPIRPLEIDGVKYGVLACSGVIAPEFYRDLVVRDANVLVNSASLSTMGMGKEFFGQAYQMARFQAVANSRSMVQSARGKQSFVMDKNGTITAQNPTENTSYFVADIQPETRKTIYSVIGEWVVAVSALGLALYYLIMRKRKNSAPNKK